MIMKYENIFPNLRSGGRNFENLLNFQNCFIDALPTSPQLLSNVVSKWNYFNFCPLDRKCPNMEISTQTSKCLENFENY